MTGELATTDVLPAVEQQAAERYRTDADTALDVLRRQVVAIFGDELPTLAGQPEPLAQGIARLDTLLRDLGVLRGEAEALLLDAMGDEHDIDVPFVGRVERYTPKDRPHWASIDLLEALIRQALDPEGTGELPASPVDAVTRVVEALVECAPFTASMSWRKTPLKARGLYAGGKPEATDDLDGDGRERLRDRAGYMTYTRGAEKVRMPSLEGKRL